MKIGKNRVLITGSAIRVGAELARHLATAGFEPIIHYKNSKVEAEALANSLNGQAIFADFTTPPTLEVAQKFLAECGEISAIINNASAYLNSPSETLYSVNHLWPTMLTKLFAQTLKEQNRAGSVVNMLDSSVMNPEPNDPYIQSKYLLREDTLRSAKLYAPYLRVNGVAPGPTLPPEELKHLKMQKTLSVIPLGRKVSTNDVAEAVRFMLEANSVTGAILDVDCGMRLLKCKS